MGDRALIDLPALEESIEITVDVAKSACDLLLQSFLRLLPKIGLYKREVAVQLHRPFIAGLAIALSLLTNLFHGMRAL